MQREVVVVSGVRTAIGKFGGSLKDVPTTELGALVVREVLARAGVAGDQVGHVVFGNVIPTEPKDLYLSRVAAMNGGIAESAPAFTVNRLCGSGLQAIISAAQTILLGDAEVAIGGGAENMSRAPFISTDARFGSRMGDSRLIDMMLGALNDPFETVPMGVTAENVAQRYQVSRAAQEELAVVSHAKAAAARAEGRLADEIVPIRTAAGLVTEDGCIRPGTSAEGLAGLKPAFREDGSVTAGTSSPLTDGASATLICSAAFAREHGLVALAKIRSAAVAPVAPELMGIGPIPASRKALARAGIGVDALDVIEINEAFASQAIACIRELELDEARVNLDGGGLAIGHPLGATGARLVGKAAALLQRTGGRYALATQCIGGGQGIATVLEAV